MRNRGRLIGRDSSVKNKDSLKHPCLVLADDRQNRERAYGVALQIAGKLLKQPGELAVELGNVCVMFWIFASSAASRLTPRRKR